MYLEFMTPFEVAKLIAEAAKEKRLSLNMSQQTLSERSGVSLSVLKKFERTGRISLESLLKLAHILGSLKEFSQTFAKSAYQDETLDSILKQKKRKRGRK